MAVQGLDRFIESTPDIAGGQPRIAGHRITVRDIAIYHQRMGKSVDEICVEYALRLAEVHAALAYYFDHREDIDRSIEDGNRIAETMRNSTPSALEQRLKILRGE